MKDLLNRGKMSDKRLKSTANVHLARSSMPGSIVHQLNMSLCCTVNSSQFSRIGHPSRVFYFHVCAVDTVRTIADEHKLL